MSKSRRNYRSTKSNNGMAKFVIVAIAILLVGVAVVGALNKKPAETTGKPTTRTVTFQIDGTAFASSNVTAGKSVDAPTAPTKEGYEFVGWVDASGNIVSFPYTPTTASETLTASFTIETRTVTFQVDGTTFSTSNVESGKSIDAPTSPTKEGYEFTGWVDASGNKVSFPYTPSTKSETLTASFTESITGYTVTVYNNCGGKYVEEVSITINGVEIAYGSSHTFTNVTLLTISAAGVYGEDYDIGIKFDATITPTDRYGCEINQTNWYPPTDIPITKDGNIAVGIYTG